MLNKKFLLGTSITAVSKEEVLEFITKGLKNTSRKWYIVTPNPELLVIAHKNPDYKKVLNGAKLALPDGIGVVIAGKILNKQVRERITGVELVESVSKKVAKQPITIGFLGGGPGVAVRTADCLVKKYPGLKVAFAGEEWEAKGFKRNYKEIDILFVAFGSPKQEYWIAKNINKLPIKVAIGVGGAFDFISGKVRRAPVWVQKAGLEWLFRLINQPWRAKRQLSLFIFVYLVFKERFNPSNRV